MFVVSKDGLTEAQQTLPNGIPSNDPSLPDLDTPLYVLVNSNTASAAEVLAGALKVRDYFLILFLCTSRFFTMTFIYDKNSLFF